MDSVPDGIDPQLKLTIPLSLTVAEWNSVVDTLSAEELTAEPNEFALSSRDAIRSYLRTRGYRRSDFV